MQVRNHGKDERRGVKHDMLYKKKNNEEVVHGTLIDSVDPKKTKGSNVDQKSRWDESLSRVAKVLLLLMTIHTYIPRVSRMNELVYHP